MPTIFRLRLIPQADVSLLLEHAPAQGWFLALVRTYDPAWANVLHPNIDEDHADTFRNEQRPYSISPLCHSPQFPFRVDDTLRGRVLTSGKIRAGQSVSLRVGLVEDERARRLLSALPDLSLPLLGDVPCRLERFPQIAADDPDTVQVSWAVLADAPPAQRLQVRFETPTMFTQMDEMWLLPEPQRLLENWYRAWQFAPTRPMGAETVTVQGLWINRYVLETRPNPLKGGLQIGFQGSMDLIWNDKATLQQRRAFMALARISRFLGTGAKTTLGMGQTRVTVIDKN